MSGRVTAIKDMRFAFLGGGNMAEALVKGLLTGLAIDPRHIVATDIVRDRCDYLRKTYGVGTLQDNSLAVRDSQVVFLAVKPQTVPALLASVAPIVGRDKLVVSIAAGIPLSTLQHALPDNSRIIRVMPNTPALVLEGAAGISASAAATEADIALVESIFNAVGRATVVSDSMMDTVTGLSGSGPAFVFALIEGLSDGGVLMGLDRPTSTMLAAQTVMGAAKMVLETGRHPGELKDMVTSPAGTTIAAMEALEEGGLRGLMMAAVRRATERSEELGRGLK